MVHQLSILSLISSRRGEADKVFFSMHPLVAEWLRLTCDTQPEGCRTTLFRAVHLVSAMLKQKVTMREDCASLLSIFSENQKVLAHMTACANNLATLHDSNYALGTYPFEDDGFLFSMFLAETCEYDRATELCKAVIGSRKSRRGDSHESVWEAVALMGKLIRLQGRLRESVTMHFELYQYRVRQYGETDLRTIRAMLDFAEDHESLTGSMDATNLAYLVCFRQQGTLPSSVYGDGNCRTLRDII